MACCEKEYGHTYAFIVFVSSILLTIGGFADIITASQIADDCTYAYGLIPLVLIALGVVTVMTGLLFVYIIGIELEYGGPFFSNVHWKSFKGATWAFALITYLAGLILSVVLELVTRGVQDTGCVDLRGYVIFRLFATAAVPVSPIVLVLIILAFCLMVLLLYIALVCSAALFGSND